MISSDGLRIFPDTANSSDNSKTLVNNRGSFNSGCIDWYGNFQQVYAKVPCTVTISSGYFESSCPDESSYVKIYIYKNDSLYKTIKDYEGSRFSKTTHTFSETLTLNTNERCSIRVQGGKGGQIRTVYYADVTFSATART